MAFGKGEKNDKTKAHADNMRKIKDIKKDMRDNQKK